MTISNAMPTLKEFNETVALLREAYPFTDNAKIDFVSQIMGLGKAELSLVEVDEKTGTLVVMTREYVRHEADKRL